MDSEDFKILKAHIGSRWISEKLYAVAEVREGFEPEIDAYRSPPRAEEGFG